MIEEIRKRKIIKRVRLKRIFSQPRRWVLDSERILLFSLAPLDWRKIKAERTRQRIIWIIVRVIFIFF